MKEPWTPGPWKATQYNDGQTRPFWNVTQERIDGPRGFSPYVASVDHDANARLIAAAPEMAEWLSDLLAWDDKTDQYDGVGLLPHDAAGIRALLTRIRGES
jgi:hypothetical protein